MSLFSGPKKPYSAVTVQIDRMTGGQYEGDDLSGIIDLIEVIRIQDTGPTEAARAIRKKLKYGSVHKQLRALTILDGLIQNAGPRFQRTFADEPLLERLRVAGTDTLSDEEVKKKCAILFRQWAMSHKNTPGMEGIVALHRQLPQRKRPVRQDQSKVLKETEQDANNENPFAGGEIDKFKYIPVDTTSNTSSSSSQPPTLSLAPSLAPTVVTTSNRVNHKAKNSKDGKKNKVQPFNLEREKPQLLQTIASSSVAATNLLNALKFVNREDKRVSEDPETVKRFQTCKQLRRQVLRYIQLVESEQWLGSLIHANDELITALISFEVLDKSVDDDSDSEEGEWDENESPAKPETQGQRDAQEAFAGLSLSGADAPVKPPRPGMTVSTPLVNGKGRDDDSDEDHGVVEDDEDDPFADRNAVHTPKGERPGMTW